MQEIRLSLTNLFELGAFQNAYRELVELGREMGMNVDKEWLIIVFLEAAQTSQRFVGLSKSFILKEVALKKGPALKEEFDCLSRALWRMVEEGLLDHEAHNGELIFFPTERLVANLILPERQSPPSP